MSTKIKKPRVELDLPMNLDLLWTAAFWGYGEDADKANEIILGALEMGLNATWILLETLPKIQDEKRTSSCAINQCLGDMHTLTAGQRESMFLEIQHTPCVSVQRNEPGYGKPEWAFYSMPRDCRWNYLCEECEGILEGTRFKDLYVGADWWKKALRDSGQNRLFWPIRREMGPEGGVAEYQAVGNDWHFNREVAVTAVAALVNVKEQRLEAVRQFLLEMGETEDSLQRITVIRKRDLYQKMATHRAFQKEETIDGKIELVPIAFATFKDQIKKTFKWPDNRMRKVS